MSLMKFNKRPWGNLVSNDFFNNDDFFNGGSWLGKLEEPAMNVKENDDNFEIELAAPGYDKKDFNVSIDNGCLNISAENSNVKKEEEDNYSRKEFSYTSFQKSLRLPESVADDKIKASYKDGVLKFKIAKKEEAKKHSPKTVEIS
ncbi:Hsp20/alpha crystallin family protein [Zobellia uliginosa]|uniref:Hsp20/alpha crystallin family protein n=1 Tax=Zobellia uliginosa TaxID=143224 RepID=UPI0026E265F6|nr:Hsp20/alpha crystallin family protein [Zobellia uliginosa]MDO6518207.1 Hsp20/alpha crystallin family protein [Zobellia uliginosa]